jgi:hypothetical protein
MKYLLLACLFAATANALPVNPICPTTVGGLALHVASPRTSCISPCLIFFDATTTTDSTIVGNTSVFQDVTFTWNFGDTLASGRGTWAYGSNPGVNSMNVATGGVAAHLFITQGRDTKFTVTVTAQDAAGNKAVCGLAVTAFEPTGTNGFSGTNTTCVAATTLPVAGSGGCPAGAGVLTQSNFTTAISSKFGAGKRVLFKCGDTFTGDNASVNAVKGSIDAYGGCQGTQVGLPVFSDTTSGNAQILIGPNAGDVRVSNISFNGNNIAQSAVWTQAFVTQNIPYQITMYNLRSTGNANNYLSSQGAQWGLIASTALTATNISVYFNTEANNPAQMFGTFPNINYQAAIGNFVNGVGSGTSGGIEAFRVSACRLCVFENNTIQNANSVGAVFKFHSGNTYGSCGDNNGVSGCAAAGNAMGTPPCVVGGPSGPFPTGTFATTSCWTGVYSELNMITDNLFTGNSGGVLSDITPQNGGVDERMRNFVIERNVYNSPTNACCDALLLLGGTNMTFRDNALYMPAVAGVYAVVGASMMQRGTGNLQLPQFDEAYNNTCYAPNTEPLQECIGFDGLGGVAPPSNSFAKNNMFYVPTTATGPAVNNSGSGNTVSNNTATVTVNPGFSNASGTFKVISDFKPSTAFTGGTSVPVIFDALGVLWSPTWDLGAVHH